MLRYLRLGCAMMAVCVPLAAAQAQTTIFREPLSPRIANYHIQVTLDDTNKTIQGQLQLTWTNPSDDVIPDLQFHLYYNAFRNAKSTFIRENMGSAPWARDNGWGWMDIRRIAVRGQDVTDSLRFIAPDDGNADDRTVAQVMLPQPVQPRETLEVDIEFFAKIPRNHVRTGWWGEDFFFMAQWFPKIGVYEPPGMRLVPKDAPRGQWNCHQFHAHTEFYADFGVYDVEITLPKKYVVATTGIIEREVDHADGTKTVVAHAEDVHDFAWLADASVLDYSDAWENPKTGQRVAIRLLLQPGHEIAKDNYFESAKATLAYFDEWLGPYAYPYPLLTIVDPQPGSGAGGMEYPTLITGMMVYPAAVLTRERLRMVETVTIHELGHQYWYGMVANNEFEEAFLDEGFNTYSENRIGDDLYGKAGSLIDFWGFRASLESVRRMGYVLGEGQRDARVADPTFAAFNGSNFAYNKWSLALKTLENYLGRERFDQIMRTYFQRWRFKHPSRNDFIAVANEVSGQDLSWFFDSILLGDGVIDYGIARVRSVPVSTFERGPDTTQASGADRLEASAADSLSASDTLAAVADTAKADTAEAQKPEVYYHHIVIRRIGEVAFPVEVLIRFEDGTEKRERWDGQSRLRKFTFTYPSRLDRVVIDPDYKVPLDVNWLNNSWTRPNEQFKRKYRWKWFFWMQSILALLATIS